MKKLKVILFCFLLDACTAHDSRYRDTAMLEKPPELNANNEIKIIDTSSVKQDIEGTGLGNLVYLKSNNPPLLIIKQPFDVAWQTLGNALRADKLEITDKEHDTGRYFVTYDPDKISADDSSFLNKTLSYFDDNNNEERYVLTVKDNGLETEVTAANNSEPKQSSKNDENDKLTTQPSDGAQKLLLSIFKTMSERSKYSLNKAGLYNHKD